MPTPTPVTRHVEAILDTLADTAEYEMPELAEAIHGRTYLTASPHNKTVMEHDALCAVFAEIGRQATARQQYPVLS